MKRWKSLPGIAITALIASFGWGGGEYIDKLPYIEIPDHPGGAMVGYEALPFGGSCGHVNVCEPCGQSAQRPWAYDEITGQLVVNCTHADSHNRIWSTY